MSRAAMVLGVILGAACLAEGVLLVRMDARLGRLEAARGPDDRVRVTDGGSPVRERVDALEQRVALLDGDGSVGGAPRDEMSETSDGETTRTTGPSATLEARVTALVDRRLEERRRKEREGNAFGDQDKPAIGELAKAVEMTAVEEDGSVRAIDEGKRRLMELLEIRRADGTTMLDPLVAAIRDAEDPGKAMQHWIQGLMTEKVPGRPQTYMAEILKIKEATWESLGRVLREEQVTRLRRLGVDVLEVKTGFDPFEELLSRE